MAALALPLLAWACAPSEDIFGEPGPNTGGSGGEATTTSTTTSGGGTGPGGQGGNAGGGGDGGGTNENDPTDYQGLKLWLRSDSGVSLQGSSVASWQDVTGNGHSANQSVGTKRPTLVNSGIDGKPVIAFDGVDDALVVPEANSTDFDPGDGSFMVMMVGRFVSGSGYHALVGKASTYSANNWRLLRQPSNQIGLWYGHDTQLYSFSTATLSNGTSYVMAWGVDASKSEVFYLINGDKPERHAETLHSMDNNEALHIGHDTAGNYAANIELAELVLYRRSGALPDADIMGVADYFYDRYGINP